MDNNRLAFSSLAITLEGILLVCLIGTPMTAVVKQVSAQECPSVTGIPFIDNLNCQVCGVACGTNPANEQFKDSTYLPPLSEEELWDRCWEQATSSNRRAELYCNSIFQHCINYEFTVEECYAAKFVQLGVPIPFYVLESIGQKTAAVGEQVDAVYRSQMCPYRDGNTVIYGDYC